MNVNCAIQALQPCSAWHCSWCTRWHATRDSSPTAEYDVPIRSRSVAHM
jgi:hypothetical protein